MSLPVSDLVSVSVSVSPNPPTKSVNMGALVVIGDSPRLPFGDRIRTYANLLGVGADFQVTDPEYLAAKAWFAAQPAPNLLKIARRFNSATPGELLGSVNFTGTVASFAAIASGSLHVSIDGTGHDVTAINLTGVTTLAGVAAAVQAAIAAVVSGVTVTYQNGRFILRSGTTGTSSAVSYSTTAASGTYLGLLLGFDATQLGVLTTGAAAELVTQSLNNIYAQDSSWYGLFLTAELEDATDIEAIAAWAESNFVLYFYSNGDSNIQDGSSTTDLASVLSAADYMRTCGQWDNNGLVSSPYSILTIAAVLLTTDFNQANSSKTLMFKQEPGVAPVNITEAQRQTLKKKHINYYTFFGDTQMFAEGVVANGQYVDEVFGLDALNLEIQNQVFALMISRGTKVSQTDRDLGAIKQAIGNACRKFVNAGFLAPGQWNGQGIGEVQSGQFLKSGFYVYIAPVASQSPTDRAARLAPPITVLATGAGAVHNIEIQLNFQR